MTTPRIALALTTALLAGIAQASTLHVPGSASTIQGAINLAGNGDTILVAPGTYVETINFLGKAIVVQSDAGAAVTILDGAGGGPVVRVDGAEPAGAALRGFTVTGGAAGVFVVVGVPPFGFTGTGGAGVYVGPGAHLELADCTITGNHLGGSGTHGAGVATNQGTVTLLNCALTDNSADNGAALSNMALHGVISLIDCTVSGNVVTGSSPKAAIAIDDGVFSAANCLVADNQGTGLRGRGIGPYTGCTFQGNTGWGVQAFEFIGTEVYDCVFLGNGLGGAQLVGVDGTSFHTIKRCVFAAGDTLEVQTPAYIEECTFDAASVHLSASGFAPGHVVNSIARNVSPLVIGTAVDISYSNIQGGAPGSGNIDIDPHWVNPGAHDYHLMPTSPCIDTGDPAALLDADLTPADMGAFTSAAWADRGGGTRWEDAYVAWARLTGQGALAAGANVGLRLERAPPSLATILLLGLNEAHVVYKGGVLWPTLDLVVPGVVTNASGAWWIAGTLPAALPSGTTLLAQVWFHSPVAGFGGTISNGVRVTAP